MNDETNALLMTDDEVFKDLRAEDYGDFISRTLSLVTKDVGVGVKLVSDMQRCGYDTKNNVLHVPPPPPYDVPDFKRRLSWWRGCVDHELAHFLFTNWRSGERFNDEMMTYEKNLHRSFDLLENGRAERLMKRRFPATSTNLNSLESLLHRVFTQQHDTDPESFDHMASAVRMSVCCFEPVFQVPDEDLERWNGAQEIVFRSHETDDERETVMLARELDRFLKRDSDPSDDEQDEGEQRKEERPKDDDKDDDTGEKRPPRENDERNNENDEAVKQENENNESDEEPEQTDENDEGEPTDVITEFILRENLRTDERAVSETLVHRRGRKERPVVPLPVGMYTRTCDVETNSDARPEHEHELLSASSVLVRQLINRLRAPLSVSKLTDHGRLNRRRLARHSLTDDMFRTTVKRENVNAYVKVIIDCSGSMNRLMTPGTTFLACVRRAAYVVCEALFQARVRFDVVGFTCSYVEEFRIPAFTRHGYLFHYRFVRSDDWNTKKKVLLDDEANFSNGCLDNDDGESLREFVHELLREKASRRLAVVFSDGEPDAYVQTGNQHQHLRQVVENARANGVEVYAVGINYDTVAQFYGEKNSVMITDPSVEKLVETLSGFVDVLTVKRQK